MGDLGKESGGVRGREWYRICIAVSAVESLCVYLWVCVCVWMRRADNWTAARSPGHPAAVEKKLSMANAWLLPVFHKKLTVLVLSKQMCTAYFGVSMCFQASVHCVWVSACECVLFQTDVFFFPNVCVLAESDQHQPVQWVWPRWIIFSARLLQLLWHTYTYTHIHLRY